MEAKRTVYMFRVYFNINTKAMRNGLAVRIFPATTRTFTKDTALSEHGRAQHCMCELAQHDTVGARQGHSTVCVN